jgi:hypothetical protein
MKATVFGPQDKRYYRLLTFCPGQEEYMTQVKVKTFSQTEVEQRTGLSREVLRKWELRYQFPSPIRGLRGQRQYHAYDVEQLQLISHLLKRGLRAGALVPKTADQLRALWQTHRVTSTLPIEPSDDALTSATNTLLDTFASGQNPHALNAFLQGQLALHGLETFVAHLMPAFNSAIGDAWETGCLSIAAEHQYTASLRQVVLRALPTPGQANTPPRVLLTTPPTELHSLGLLALHAQLSLHGAICVDLDTQTPLTDVLHTVDIQQIGIVAVSLSGCMLPHEVRAYVHGLQSGLPGTCALWVGGKGCAALEPNDFQRCEVFTDTASAVQRWLALSST